MEQHPWVTELEVADCLSAATLVSVLARNHTLRRCAAQALHRLLDLAGLPGRFVPGVVGGHTWSGGGSYLEWRGVIPGVVGVLNVWDGVYRRAGRVLWPYGCFTASSLGVCSTTRPLQLTHHHPKDSITKRTQSHT